MLGVGLAFGIDALDTRVRSATEIGERLGLPLLARVPPPPKGFAKENRLVMLAQPTGTSAEAFRMLRTNLDFATLEDVDVRTILVTSAVEQEGKSTTAANLALAEARAGRRVALVDLDLRRPVPRPLLRPAARARGSPTWRSGTSSSARRCTGSTWPPARARAPKSDAEANGNARDLGSLDVLVVGPAAARSG